MSEESWASTIGGVGISVTGVGAVAGVPVMVVSGSAVVAGTVQLAQGIGVCYSSMGNLGKNLREFTENRPPKDSKTILSDRAFKCTNKRVQGAVVYEKDGKYYYRDQLHGAPHRASHLEVYDKHGNHIDEDNIYIGEIRSGTADSTKKLPR